MKKKKGTISWYNSLSKEGMIRYEGKNVWFYGCNADGALSYFPELSCVYYEQGQEVEFEIHETLGAVNVSGARIDYGERDQKIERFPIGFKGFKKGGIK